MPVNPWVVRNNENATLYYKGEEYGGSRLVAQWATFNECVTFPIRTEAVRVALDYNGMVVRNPNYRLVAENPNG